MQIFQKIATWRGRCGWRHDGSSIKKKILGGNTSDKLIVEKNPCNIPLICLKTTSKVKNREKYRNADTSDSCT